MGFGPSPMEIAVIAVIALIVLGPQKLPEAARSLGKGFREMRDSFSGVADSNEHLDEYPNDDDDEEFGDEDDEPDEPELESHDEDDEPSDEPDETEGHQKDAESSVPSASSSSTERE